MLNARVGSLSARLRRRADTQARTLDTAYSRQVETCGPLEADTVVSSVCTDAANAYQELVDDMKTGVIDVEQGLTDLLQQFGISPDCLDVHSEIPTGNVVGDTDASGFISDELVAGMPLTVMAGIGAAAGTKALFVAALNASLASAVRPALFRISMLGLGRTAFIAGVGGAATGGAASGVQAAGASVIFGPAGWIVGGTITGVTMYRSWRKAKRRNAQLVLKQACDGLRAAAVELHQALDDARDRILAALPG